MPENSETHVTATNTSKRRPSPRHIAAASGQARYSGGRPCKYGHRERFTTNAACVQCHRDNDAKRREKLRERREQAAAKKEQAVKRQKNLKQSPRQIALAKGEARYFNGNPCKYGHVAARFTRTAQCVACRGLADQARYRKRKQAKEAQENIKAPNDFDEMVKRVYKRNAKW